MAVVVLLHKRELLRIAEPPKLEQYPHLILHTRIQFRELTVWLTQRKHSDTAECFEECSLVQTIRVISRIAFGLAEDGAHFRDLDEDGNNTESSEHLHKMIARHSGSAIGVRAEKLDEGALVTEEDRRDNLYMEKSNTEEDT